MTTQRTGISFFRPSPTVNPVEAPQDRIKFVLVTGGVCSSLGKGVTTSTIGALLRTQGYHVSAIKIDPYINVDAGLMSPFEHGEVFVLDDGGEVDLDLGNYERWMGLTLSRDHNITTGKVYEKLISTERQGKFLGKTVQVVPHFTGEVIRRITEVATVPTDSSGNAPQVCLIELGGTVGDLESAPFMEALRQLRFSLLPEDFAVVHCTYLPCMGGEQKTKPTQHSCRTLLSLGMQPDLVVCRTEQPLADGIRTKLGQLCGLQEKYIIGAHNVASLYDVPTLFSLQEVGAKVSHKLRLTPSPYPPALGFPTLADYKVFSQAQRESGKTARIAFVGKYAKPGTDTYFSVMQTFEHCCIKLRLKIAFVWVDSETLEGDSAEAAEAKERLTTVDGIFVAGGFGKRGIDGKVEAARIAREKNIPYLGVCLGMQVAVMDFARNVLGLAGATSEEFDKDNTVQDHVVVYMPEIDRATMGANMRLGARPVHLTAPESKLTAMYSGATQVLERHRHRYEFNMQYHERMKAAGMVFTASDDPTYGKLCRVEGIEHPGNRFFVAVQYHPEFRSWPNDPSPPYCAFVAAAAGVAPEWPGDNSRKIGPHSTQCSPSTVHRDAANDSLTA